MSLDLPSSPSDAPTPPFSHVPGIANLRDVGGYALSSGTGTGMRSVARGRLFRSADPSRVTRPDGLRVLEDDLGIRKIFDLRSTTEIKRVGKEWEGVAEDRDSPFDEVNGAAAAAAAAADPPADEAGSAGDGTSRKRITRHFVPVFSDQDYSPEQIAIRYSAYTRGAAGFAAAYADILAAAGPSYGPILRHLAGEGAAPALVHCTAGKDRTGVLVVVLLLFLGVAGEDVAREYALTDVGLRLMKPLFRERLLRNEALAGNPAGVDSMISSTAENALRTVELLRDRYGGAEGYLREVVGLTDDELQGLRTNLSSVDMPVL